jgi:drug/metabolite transporter (DMT)-like permease
MAACSPMRRMHAVWLLILVTLMWSSGGVLVKLVDLHPLATAGMRSAIAGLVVLAFLRRPRFALSWSLWGGAVAFAASQLLFISATRLTTAANAVFLQYTAPIHVAVFGTWFLKERLRWLDALSIGAVLVGMFLFFGDELTTAGLWGNVCAVGSGVAFAWVILVLRQQKDGPILEIVLLGNLLTALAGVPFMFAGLPDAKGWLGIVLLGVFQLGLSYVLYAVVIKHLRAMEAVLIQTIEPILNPVWVLVFLAEVPGRWALVGGGIVLLSVTFCAILVAREKELPVPGENQVCGAG